MWCDKEIQAVWLNVKPFVCVWCYANLYTRVFVYDTVPKIIKQTGVKEGGLRGLAKNSGHYVLSIPEPAMQKPNKAPGLSGSFDMGKVLGLLVLNMYSSSLMFFVFLQFFLFFGMFGFSPLLSRQAGI